MNFDNTELAYRVKTNRELYRALYLFRLISNNTLVSLGSKLAIFALKLKLPIELLKILNYSSSLLSSVWVSRRACLLTRSTLGLDFLLE